MGGPSTLRTSLFGRQDMQDKPTQAAKTRGAEQAYSLSLEVEIWAVDQPRPSSPTVYRAANISMQEFQFISANPFDVHHRFNFAVLFPKPSKGQSISLLVGAARVVRRTRVSTLGGECFVVDAKIEQICSMWDGEEKSRQTRRRAS